MNYTHAISLEKPLLSLEEILAIFNRKKNTMKQSDTYRIAIDTEHYIWAKMANLELQYDDYKELFSAIVNHDCKIDCRHSYQADMVQHYSCDCTLELVFQEWGNTLIHHLGFTNTKVVPNYDENNETSHSEIKHSFQNVCYPIVEIIGNFRLENQKILNDFPNHLGIQFAYSEPTSELYMHMGEKYLPGLYRILLLLRIFELAGFKANF
ncbi:MULTISPECIES: hypothetical protein [unclassified Bacillus (in: firmicutes)]|uniref:hypothetical protein n=1 Tax=unclassified Bacillus (in: firmicutes) TaxID=185979 RepID=UPI000BF9C38E|nr:MULTISPECIES: hypothetical protein [unclassified Bacillus (in: firmicutes)]PEU18137.1 hypothetical protein CN525_13035 [Bacillus sp. AFS014408]PFW62406.1 hypothetical protein COL20_13245 [Bacillus sp. AFS075034]